MVTELGKIFRKLRIDNGQILKDMADVLNISSAQLSSVENGKRKPQRKMIEGIISAYHLDGHQQHKLWDAFDETRKEITISLNSASGRRRDMGLALARQFDGLSSAQVDEILSILHRNREE
ncbi:helix-turn-helix domain-containing protein [Butyricicoccus faecihominis]|uniref:helix-turn-helix domain-containing protein n=1 Tax=Butyricicoccus faecihominis TaxID=1712515 RepID=UPI0024793343|nr:helix-turn-helix transcriptional regulator [Butyricicoccus faecihominis]MCQ5130408.1 helix-turn-helix domain-containing protein [Butyricicoccus faecihominis]